MLGKLLVLGLSLAALSDADRHAREVWFDATILGAALAPCAGAFPDRASEFERHVQKWQAVHAQAIARGEASFREEAGDAFRPEEFDQDGAERQFTELLAGMDETRRTTWCENQLQLSPDARNALR